MSYATRYELTMDDVATFGWRDAAAICRKRGWPFEVTHWVMFGRAPRFGRSYGL